MFQQRPTPRRIATGPDQRTLGEAAENQTAARLNWFKNPYGPYVKLTSKASATRRRYYPGALAQ